jgi:hypothetical protein
LETNEIVFNLLKEIVIKILINLISFIKIGIKGEEIIVGGIIFPLTSIHVQSGSILLNV